MPVSRAILYATLVVGALDAADGVVIRGLQGLNPIQVLQYIASSLLGARSFSGGLATAGLGLVVHFAIAMVVATIYIAELVRSPANLAITVFYPMALPAFVARMAVSNACVQACGLNAITASMQRTSSKILVSLHSMLSISRVVPKTPSCS